MLLSCRFSPDDQEQFRIFREQIADMSSVLDHLGEIDAALTPARQIIDAERIAAAGHSMGALIATAVSGLARTAPDGELLRLRDERYDIAVLLSGPGPLPRTPPGAWDSVTLPTLVTTGTRDHANRGGEGADWEWRLGAFELTPAGNKYALIVDSADHFLGGAICPERVTTEPDTEALGIVETVSTAFLDAYLKDEAAARATLDVERIAAITGGRAELRIR
jgi:pimeloyl-ACP methyl ester carboxylesterase